MKCITFYELATRIITRILVSMLTLHRRIAQPTALHKLYLGALIIDSIIHSEVESVDSRMLISRPTRLYLRSSCHYCQLDKSLIWGRFAEQSRPAIF